MDSKNLYLSKHVTIDFYGCDNKTISKQKSLEKILVEACELIGANVIKSEFHEFCPQGVSGVVVLSESHMTIHSWPEHSYAAIDIFVCGDMDIKKGILFLEKKLGSETVQLVSDLNRGIISNINSSNKKRIMPESFENISLKNRFKNEKSWGLATSVDIYNCNPKTIRDSDMIKKYVRELCELIKMKRFGKTEVVHFGEDEKVAGYSMTQLIETSLISGHFANKTNAAYIDIFSCKYYNPNLVAEFTINFFGGKNYKLNINFRDEK